MTYSHTPPGDRPGQAADGSLNDSRSISSTEVLRSEAVTALASPSDFSGSRMQPAADLPVPSLSIDSTGQEPVPVIGGSLDVAKAPRDNPAILNRTTTLDRAENPSESGASKLTVLFGTGRGDAMPGPDAANPDEAMPKADFVIKKDGVVEMLHDPETFRDRQIVVVVEAGAGQTAPTDAQIKAVQELSQYLSARMQRLDPQQRLTIEVSEQLERAVAASQELERMPAPTRQQVDAMERFGGNDGGPAGGQMTRRQVDEYFPPREVPQQKGETHPLMAMKDTVAGMFNADKKRPYETARQMSDGSFAVGRYGLNDDLIFSWFSMLPDFEEMLGNPPDWSKLGKLMEQLAKKGKISKEFAAKFKDPKFAAEFGSFMQKLAGGKGNVTAAEVKQFLPREFQEQIAGDLIDRFAKASGGNPQAVALTMHLGKPIEQLSQKDIDGNRKFTDAALKMYGLAIARQQAGDDDRIEWRHGGSGSPLALRIARAAENNARANNTVGWCYREVADTLDNFGINLHGASAYMAADQLARNKRVHEVSMSDLRPGDILVHGKAPGHKHGHIAVYLGNRKEASDHVQTLISGRGYGGTRVFRVNA